MSYYLSPNSYSGESFMLTKSQSEFDCKKSKIRVISGSVFVNFAMDRTNDHLNGDWINALENTDERFMLDAACQSKRK
jgi:hypothetical protein